MSVGRSVCPSDVILREESERKWAISADEVVASYETRGSYNSLTNDGSRFDKTIASYPFPGVAYHYVEFTPRHDVSLLFQLALRFVNRFVYFA